MLMYTLKYYIMNSFKFADFVNVKQQQEIHSYHMYWIDNHSNGMNEYVKNCFYIMDTPNFQRLPLSPQGR